MTTIRSLTPDDYDTIEIVATNMRRTLVEVLGQARGSSMYNLEQTRDRVREHLDATRLTGAVFVAGNHIEICGHALVRIDKDLDGSDVGLVGTIYVTPEARRTGIAKRLVAQAETWMATHAMTRAVTFTANDNHKLHNLFTTLGYELTDAPDDFVRLARRL